MSGIFVDNGHDYLLDIWVGSNTPASMYMGLMNDGSYTSDNLTTTDLQLGSQITEITGTGYTRQEVARGWSISSSIGSGSEKTFTVGVDGWNNVRGYFLSETVGGNDVIYCESFPIANQGNKAEGAELKITPKIEFRSFGE